MKQWEMAEEFSHNPALVFKIGDVRDSSRISRCMSGCDLVVHAAATKIVPTAEYNPIECIKTNINGAINVIDASLENNISNVVALSTDKACNPANLYGATKLASDKLFVAANDISERVKTKFSVVRYGNVVASRGSVIPFFLRQSKSGVLTITDPAMTRFLITLTDAVELVWHTVQDMLGGEIYVKKIPSILLKDLADVIAPSAEKKIIGIRPGEKLHEIMISPDDSLYTYSYPHHFKILPSIHDLYLDPLRIKDGTKVPQGFCYSSDTNTEWLNTSQLSKWLQSLGLL